MTEEEIRALVPDKDELFSPKTCLMAGLRVPRFRYVLWVLLAVSAIGLFVVGNRDAGSYFGYEAGSILHPERYEDTAWTARYGDDNGLNAETLNRKLGEMRDRNLPEFVGCGLLLVASLGATAAVGFGCLATTTGMMVLFEMDDAARARFSEGYRRHEGHAPRDDGRGSFELARYAMECVGQPGADGGVAGTRLDAESVRTLRDMMRPLPARVWLAANGTRLDGDGHVVPLLAVLPVRLPMEVAAPAATAAAASVFCSQCGAKMSATAKFCPKCGAGTRGEKGGDVR